MMAYVERDRRMAWTHDINAQDIKVYTYLSVR